MPAIFTLCVMAFLIEGKKYLPKGLPSGSEVLIVTAASTAASHYLTYAELGGNVVGAIPAAATKLVPDLFWAGT